MAVATNDMCCAANQTDMHTPNISFSTFADSHLPRFSSNGSNPHQYPNVQKKIHRPLADHHLKSTLKDTRSSIYSFKDIWQNTLTYPKFQLILIKLFSVALYGSEIR